MRVSQRVLVQGAARGADHKKLRALGADAREAYNLERRVWHANLGPINTPQLPALHEDLWDIVDSNA